MSEIVDRAVPTVKALVRVVTERGISMADANAVVAALDLPALLAAERERALREAADVWQRGAWADAPRCADRVQERIANGQFVCDWLRERADRLAAEPAPGEGASHG